MMNDRPDQLELLALIEGELDANETARVRRRLAQDPEVLGVIDRMSADRAAMRSLGDPELPRDFVAQLEPLLARPMLMEPLAADGPPSYAKPGEYRRQYRRKTRRIRWSRLPAAAIVFLAVAVGLWAGVNGLTSRRGPVDGNRMTAANSSDANLGTTDHAADRPQPGGVLTGTVHHHWPSAVALDQFHVASAPSQPVIGGEQNPVEPGAASKAGAVLVAEFAIVVRTTDRSKTEQALTAAVTQVDQGIALVRNFNLAEAQKLAEQWRLAQSEGGSGVRQPMVALAGGERPISAAEMHAIEDRIRQRSNTLPDRSIHHVEPAEAAGNVHLAGAAERGPSLEQQLDLSNRGATHTLAVPVSELNALIERLALSEGQATVLRMLPAVDQSGAGNGVPAWQPLASWLGEGPQVRQAFDRLAKARTGTIVLVPVVVQDARDR